MTFTIVNSTGDPHHLRAVFSPPYIEEGPFADPPENYVGGIAPLDLLLVGPGETREVELTVPETVPPGYRWTLYDFLATDGAPPPHHDGGPMKAIGFAIASALLMAASPARAQIIGRDGVPASPNAGFEEASLAG